MIHLASPLQLEHLKPSCETGTPGSLGSSATIFDGSEAKGGDNMKIVVIGGTGLIGSQVVQNLCARRPSEIGIPTGSRWRRSLNERFHLNYAKPAGHGGAPRSGLPSPQPETRNTTTETLRSHLHRNQLPHISDPPAAFHDTA